MENKVLFATLFVTALTIPNSFAAQNNDNDDDNDNYIAQNNRQQIDADAALAAQLQTAEDDDQPMATSSSSSSSSRLSSTPPQPSLRRFVTIARRALEHVGNAVSNTLTRMNPWARPSSSSSHQPESRKRKASEMNARSSSENDNDQEKNNEAASKKQKCCLLALAEHCEYVSNFRRYYKEDDKQTPEERFQTVFNNLPAQITRNFSDIIAEPASPEHVLELYTEIMKKITSMRKKGIANNVIARTISNCFFDKLWRAGSLFFQRNSPETYANNIKIILLMADFLDDAIVINAATANMELFVALPSRLQSVVLNKSTSFWPVTKEDAINLLSKINPCNNCKELDLRDIPKVDASFISNLMQINRQTFLQLEKLCLGGNKFSFSERASGLDKIMPYSSDHHIINSVDFSGNDILNLIIGACTALKELVLSNCYIDRITIETIAAHSTNLKILNLEGSFYCGDGDKTNEELIQQLESTLKNIIQKYPYLSIITPTGERMGGIAEAQPL